MSNLVKNSKRQIIIAYIYLFFLLFGPKIGSYIDTSIIANIIIIGVSYRKNSRSLRLNKTLFALLLSLVLIATYALFVGLLHGNMDIIFAGRMARSFFSILGIYCFIKNTNIQNEKLQNIIINILLLHAITVIASALFSTQIQEYLRVFTGFNKTARLYRSTGLMAGFDMFGLLCVIGSLLVLLQKKFNILKYFIFSLAIVFTSRFSLILYATACILYLIVNHKNMHDKVKKACLLITTLPIIAIGFILLLSTTKNIFSTSITPDISKTFPGIYKLVNQIDVAYANTDITETVTEQVNLPTDFSQLLFGTGSYAGGDPGYVRFINCIGVLGLIIVIIWHAILLRDLPATKTNEATQNRYMLYFFALVLIFMNLKNSYFYTSTFFEILLLEIFSVRYNQKTKELS